MSMRCPSCNAQIDPGDVNIQADVAMCRACTSVLRTSDLLRESERVRELICPPGAWATMVGDERRIGATTRSPKAFFMVPFMCVWSGMALGGIYGSQLKSGKFNPVISLFGIPFLVASIVVWTMTAMNVFGRVELKIRGDEGELFTGIGSIGWTRRFVLSDFNKISESVGSQSVRGGSTSKIVLEGARRLTFGSMLNQERRFFVIESLRPLLRARG